MLPEELQAWITEMVKKGTFETEKDAIEFCIAATKRFCEFAGYSQELIKEGKKQGELETPRETIFPITYKDLEWLLSGTTGETIPKTIQQLQEQEKQRFFKEIEKEIKTQPEDVDKGYV